MHSTHLPLREHSIPRGRDGRKWGGEEREVLTAGFRIDGREVSFLPLSLSTLSSHLYTCQAELMECEGLTCVWASSSDRYEHMALKYE